MIRYIKIEDSKKRDAEITFKSINSKASVYLAMETREKPKNKKVIKSSKDKSLKALIGNANPSQEDYNKFSENLIANDNEIDFELFGRFIERTDKIYTNKKNEPVYNIKVVQNLKDPQGNLIKEQKPIYLHSNINEENIVKWTGKYIPKIKLYNKVVLSSKYQIKHVNGLTFDFLFNIAKTLHDKDSFMMMGGGKGSDPLVFNDGGKPYRGFLEGRINDKSYCLILHLSNQELKGI
jgi:hypothetical protein|tara:strand:+ start:3762 stop:4469 length:708 start_codon:yes stop_codon:yes gene_type:complete